MPQSNVTFKLYAQTVSQVIVLLLASYIVKYSVCPKSPISAFLQGERATTVYHVIALIYAGFALSRVRLEMDDDEFIKLITTTVLLETLVDIPLSRTKNRGCDMSLVSIMVSLLVWKLLKKQPIGFYFIVSVISVVLVPIAFGEKRFLVSNAISSVIGAVSATVFTLTY